MTRTLLATAWVVLLSTAASLQGQSLAGAAKKAEENRAKAKHEQPVDATKADKPPTKVYTNNDLVDSALNSGASNFRRRGVEQQQLEGGFRWRDGIDEKG